MKIYSQKCKIILLETNRTCRLEYENKTTSQKQNQKNHCQNECYAAEIYRTVHNVIIKCHQPHAEGRHIKSSLSFFKHHTMMAYGKEETCEHIRAFLTLALGGSERSVSLYSWGLTSLICTGYARMLGPDLTNTGKEKSLTSAWHSLVHSLVIY